VVLQARDFLVTEASLTGESFPVEKRPGALAADTPLRDRCNSVFLGSSVRSGTATVLVTHTGGATVFGELAAGLKRRPPETRFALGARRFGDMLMRVMFAVVLAILVVNQWLGRPLIDSLMFSVALAVGLSPELLPAIVSVMLARTTRAMAAQGVLVRRLEAIEDLGGMNVLCTDKTGTLTQGVMTLDAAVDAWVESLARKLPQTTRYAKQQLNVWRDMAWHQTVGHARDWLSLSMLGDEAQSAITAFLDSRRRGG